MNASPLRLYAEAAEYCWVKRMKKAVLAVLLIPFSGCTQEPKVVASHPDRTEVVVADPIDAPMKPASEEAAEPAAFIYVKIPDGIGPLDRGEKYEDPLELKLSGAGLGHVSGGGSQLGDPRSDGSRPIEFCGLDIDATDLAKARALLRFELPLLGAPDGTELHYTIGETRLQDSYSQGKWTLQMPRTLLHPGFGI